jgi:hypothetical protein
MYQTPQNQNVSNWLMAQYKKQIEMDKKFEYGDPLPMAIFPQAIRLGTQLPNVVDGTKAQHLVAGVGRGYCCDECASGRRCGGIDVSRFVGMGNAINSINGIRPSSSAGQQSYTPANVEKMAGGSQMSVVDLANEERGSMDMLRQPRKDAPLDTVVDKLQGSGWFDVLASKITGIRPSGGKRGRKKKVVVDEEKVEEEKKNASGSGWFYDLMSGKTPSGGRRRKMTAEEKQQWAQKMKEARMKKKSGGSQSIVGGQTIVGGVKKYVKGSNKKLGAGQMPSVNTETAKSTRNNAVGGRKKMTMEERKAWGAKMKALREAKRNKK